MTIGSIVSASGLGRLRRQQRRHQVQRPLRDDKPADAAEDRQQARFAEQLADELSASRADRQPDRHLAGASRAPRASSRFAMFAHGDQQHERR